MKEAMGIGCIKAKFPLSETETLGENAAFKYTAQYPTRRVTGNFIYVMLGHEMLEDNEHGREVLREIFELGGWVTRLDFYVDLAEKFDFVGYYAMLKGLYARKPRPRMGLPSLLTSPLGQTVYVGKRSSARMLRIYDKRAEVLAKRKMDIGYSLTRFELEVKRKEIPGYKALFIEGKTQAILNDVAERYLLPSLAVKPEKLSFSYASREKLGAMAFVVRYRRILKEAYVSKPLEFLEMLGIE